MKLRVPRNDCKSFRFPTGGQAEMAGDVRDLVEYEAEFKPDEIVIMWRRRFRALRRTCKVTCPGAR